MRLEVEFTPAELDQVLDALGELLQQVDRAEQPAVLAIINRLRVAAGLPTDPLIEYGRD